MEKVTITSVYSDNKKKDGTPIISKFGKPSWRVGLKCVEHGDEFINGFLSNDGKDLIGKTIELDIYEEEYNGRKSLKFKFPRKDDARIEALEKRFKDLANFVGYIEPAGIAKQIHAQPKPMPVPVEDQNIEIESW